MKRTAFLSIACVFLAGSLALAQGMTGTIRLVVQAQDGNVLHGATVTAASPDALGTRTAVSDERGVVTLTGLDPSAAYVVTVALDHFNTARFEGVLVRAGQTTTLRAPLTLAPLEAEIEVIGETPTIDFASAISGQDITLQLTESLPTGRSYQSYLQLVPGVLPTDPSIADDNPAVRSGLNYRDIGGAIGSSRDNFYFIEGIDVTDAYTGQFGADLNTEIIQEQSVMTGGIPAEFVGAPGLVSNVVTKSGGNDFHGSVNYFFQHDGLVADNKYFEAADFSAYDTAFTVGGPIARDRAWFFASYRLLHREEEVSSLDTREYMRTVNTDSKQGFLKLSWNPSSRARLTGTLLTDPTETDGSIQGDVSNTRDRTEETGGTRYIFNYSHVFGPAYLSLSAGKHNGELSRHAANPDIRNDVFFSVEDLGTFTREDEQLGGHGTNVIDERDREFVTGRLEWYLGTGWGDHTISIGAEYQKQERLEVITQTGGVSYTSMHARYAGVTAYEIAHGLWNRLLWDYDRPGRFTRIVNAIDASPNRDLHYSILDTNGDGEIDVGEFGAVVFDSTAGNPHGMVNFQRTLRGTRYPTPFSVEGTTLYLQDSYQRKRLTINAGVRAEEWRHFATTGEKIAEFDYQLSPRLGVIYDLTGSGRMKLSAFYGRYHDPIRMNMTDFAGTLIGAESESQIFINGEWLTTRVEGGPKPPDAVFSPTTKTPYTDDFQLGYQVQIGNDMSLEALYIRRKTRDIMEDFDLCLYAYCVDESTDYPGPMDHPDSLWLGLDHFGYDVNPGSDFVIGTLAGARRDWDGVELVFRKRYSDSWQMLASYTYADAEGSSNSDSRADFQGDVLWLDPRAPNRLGRQPGIIQHLFKMAGSYHWDSGFMIGGTYRWSSGTVDNTAWWAFNRHIPIRVTEPFEFAGITTSWLDPEGVGSRTNDSWSTLDLRLQYGYDFGIVHGEFFVDVFNVLDDQAAVRNQALVHGSPDAAFEEPVAWVPPRRFYLGVRLSF